MSPVTEDGVKEKNIVHVVGVTPKIDTRCRVERIAAQGFAVASNVSLLKVSLSLEHIAVASNTLLLKELLSHRSHVEAHCCGVLMKKSLLR